MGRSPSFVKDLKKGTWTSEEDRKLVTYIGQHGHGSWREVPVKAGLRRCGKSCRLRWTNYLRPDIKRGKFNLQEAQTIIHLHALLGNRWSAIATHLPKRTDNEIKNYWNVHLKKQLTKLGIDPITHKSRTISTKLSHMTQWEIARLEAEARLVRESKVIQRVNLGPPPIVNKPSLPLPLDQNMAIVNLVEDAEPKFLEHVTLEDQTDNPNVSKDLFNTRESQKDEGTQNIPEVSEMTYQDSHLIGTFTDQMFNDANHGNYQDGFEHDISYWSSILNQPLL